MRVPILYRWWDADGNLLYVGKSISVLSRVEQHRNNSEFFDEATTMTIERYPDERTLADAEVAAIRAERPTYNIIYNREAEMADERTLSPEMHGLMCLAMKDAMGPAFASLMGRAA